MSSVLKARLAIIPASIRSKISIRFSSLLHHAQKNPIYATTIVGKPPMEDGWMGKAVERIFLPLMKLTIPEIVDINLPVEVSSTT